MWIARSKNYQRQHFKDFFYLLNFCFFRLTVLSAASPWAICTITGRSQKPDSLRAVLEKSGVMLWEWRRRWWVWADAVTWWNILPDQTSLWSPPASANVQNAVIVSQLYAFVFFLLPENKAPVIELSSWCSVSSLRATACAALLWAACLNYWLRLFQLPQF